VLPFNHRGVARQAGRLGPPPSRRGGRSRVSLRLWAYIVVAALVATTVPYLLFAVAEQAVHSSTAGIINATTPLWTVVLALAVRHQKTATSWQAAGLISAGGLECLAASGRYAVSYIYMDRFLAARARARSCYRPASSWLLPSCSQSP
jgi:drug/metabolite transporter (DMT)-like permease